MARGWLVALRPEFDAKARGNAIRLRVRRQEESVAWGKKPNGKDKWVIFPISRTSRFDATRVEPSANSGEKLKNLPRTKAGMFVAQQARYASCPTQIRLRLFARLVAGCQSERLESPL